MTKTIRPNEITFEFENIHEARGFLTALATSKMLYFQHQGSVLELKNIQNPRITITFQANIRSLDSQSSSR